MIVFFVDVAWVQPLALRGGPVHTPTYLHFWGQYGGSIPGILLGMLHSPLRLARDLLTSHWYILFLPALLLPALGRVPLVAMAPVLFLLGSARYPLMRNFDGYYATPLLPLFFWAWIEAFFRLPKIGIAGRRTVAIWASAALIFPLWGFGYVRLLRPQSGIRAAFASHLPALVAAPPERLCAQPILFPHLPYRLKPIQLSLPACMTDRNTSLLLNPRLDTFPYTRAQLESAALEAQKQGRAEDWGAGFVMIRPRPEAPDSRRGAFRPSSALRLPAGGS